jgi:hypothetical protein
LTLNHLLNPETIPGRRRPGPIVLDDDLKPLIESVYAEDLDVATRVPALLRPTLDAAAGEAIEFRRAGQRNRLSFSEGLLADCTSDALVVDDDDAFISAPTRLGENYALLLAFSDEGEVKLAGQSDNSDPIAASEIRTRWRLTQPEGDAVKQTLSQTTHSRATETPRVCDRHRSGADRGRMGRNCQTGRTPGDSSLLLPAWPVRAPDHWFKIEMPPAIRFTGCVAPSDPVFWVVMVVQRSVQFGRLPFPRRQSRWQIPVKPR